MVLDGAEQAAVVQSRLAAAEVGREDEQGFEQRGEQQGDDDDRDDVGD